MGGTQAIFMCEWMNSEDIHAWWASFCAYSCTCTQVFMPYWNLECTKAVTLHCWRWYGAISCNWGDPSWVKSTASFFQCMTLVSWSQTPKHLLPGVSITCSTCSKGPCSAFCSLWVYVINFIANNRNHAWRFGSFLPWVWFPKRMFLTQKATAVDLTWHCVWSNLRTLC